MSRVPKIDPAAFSPEQHKLYDALMASRPDGKLQGPSTMWIRNAGLAAVTGQMAKLLRYEGKLEAPLFEMITMLVARQWTAHYVWSVHAKEATRVGLAPEILEAIRTRRIPAMRIGRRLRVPSDQVAAFEAAHSLPTHGSISARTEDRT